MFSPEKVTSEQITDKNEKKHKAGERSYATFDDFIAGKGANFDKKTSPVLLMAIALLKFYSEFNRLPMSSKSDKISGDGEQAGGDISKLNEFMANMKDTMNVHESILKKLDPDWALYIDGSMSPVCAIVGGVAGQDMIRSLSGKDIPIFNTFSFNGLDMSGVVERLGTTDAKSTSVAPIVRDYLEID